MPEWLSDIAILFTRPFVGEGWHLMLGVLFMAIIIFLPGGIIEGVRRIGGIFRKSKQIEEDA